MQIRNLVIALLALVTASMAYSISAQTTQAAAKQNPQAAPEKRQVIDMSKVPLQEGTHEIYRDMNSGLRISRVVKNSKVVSYFAEDMKGRRVQTWPRCSPIICPGTGPHPICLHFQPWCID